ncbi:YdeI/OmpD-associated family protein [Sphingomonas crusticola]|uniref:YdeI/OmpD-associated family protein n=1 Tax=Sphingomonas crusticola TaxID=1697973 RepID=UPI000E283EEB|nr:YdeI/OmpD-associated family protein [Sphingomonas crusticola]
MTRDPRIDAYIAAAQPFARPILDHLRAAIHDACPDVTETIKWSRPFFEHKGRMFAALGAFKAHASLVLWRMGETGGATSRDQEGMGQFGKLTSLADLPDEAELRRAIQEATAAIEAGKPMRAKPAPRPDLPVPDELRAALAAAPAAQAVFDGFSPSNRRDYCEWIGEAKRPETRASRVAQAVEWIAEGKPRHWKYQRG